MKISFNHNNNILETEFISCDRPKLKIEALPTTIGVSKTGKHTWLPNIVIIKQNIKNTKWVGGQIQRQMNYFNNISSNDYKFIITIEFENQTYILNNCLIKHIDYSNEDILEINIMYENASL